MFILPNLQRSTLVHTASILRNAIFSQTEIAPVVMHLHVDYPRWTLSDCYQELLNLVRLTKNDGTCPYYWPITFASNRNEGNNIDIQH